MRNTRNEEGLAGVIFACLPFFAVGCLSSAGAAEVRPNIVLMVTDDQGLQCGCYGDATVKTPNLDRLASEGTRFQYAFCTTASCSPSRSVLLTGLYNHANGQYGLQHDVHNFSTRAQIKSLPVLLHEAGYRTCSIGKVHVQPESVYHFDTYANQGGQQIPQMVRNAERFLHEVQSEPFFLYFCPHEPHRAGKGFGNQRKTAQDTAAYDPARLTVPAWLPDNPQVRGDLAEYYQATSRADAALGGLMEALRSTGHDGDTLLIYVSDNGPPFPGAKTTLYEPGVHLPCVIRAPSSETRSGRVSQAMITWVDLAPTILDFAGVKPPYPLHGRSLRAVLETDPDGWDEIYLSHTFHEVTMYYPMRAVRARRYKLIMNLAHELSFPFASDIYNSPSWQSILKSDAQQMGVRTVAAFLHHPKWELYDLEKDPNEIHNLAEDAANAETLARLQRKLRDWQQQTSDPWIIKYQHE